MTTSLDGTAAAKIVAELTRQDRSVRWLSEKSGTPYTTLTRKLRGQSDIGTTELVHYAVVLGVHPSVLAPDVLAVQP